MRAGGRPPMALAAADAAALVGPDTIDCIAPADRWEAHWTDAARAKRSAAAWLGAAAGGTPSDGESAAAEAAR